MCEEEAIHDDIMGLRDEVTHIVRRGCNICVARVEEAR